MTKLESIRAFILSCPYLDKNIQLSIDIMSARSTEYLISEAPSNQMIKRFIDGSSMRQFTFTFASKVLVGGVKQNLEHNSFFETFQKWLEEMNNKKQFPQVMDGEEATEISATTGGYIFDADEKNARYQIQCKLIYISK